MDFVKQLKIMKRDFLNQHYIYFQRGCNYLDSVKGIPGLSEKG